MSKHDEQCEYRLWSGPPCDCLCSWRKRIAELKAENERLKFAIGQEEWRGQPELYEENTKLKAALREVGEEAESWKPFVYTSETGQRDVRYPVVMTAGQARKRIRAILDKYQEVGYE